MLNSVKERASVSEKLTCYNKGKLMNKAVKPLLTIGFRPFFLMAGLSAAVFLLIWGGFIRHGIFPDNYYSPVGWHAHEMLFGYALAVLSGFLLTAIRNWTGMDVASGNKLAILAVIWLLGRLVPFANGLLPAELIAGIDLLFLPVLISYLAMPLWTQRKIQNLPILLLLAVMFAANLLFHLTVLGYTESGVTQSLYLTIGVVMVFIVIIAGRVFPFFIRGGLPGSNPMAWPIVDKLSLFSIVGLMILKPFFYETLLFTLCAGIAILSNIVRMSGWYCRGISKLPLLWVLLTGYSWLIIGIVLDVLASYQAAPPQLALHSITVGAIGVITLGMMSRVALGHTGRPLIASRSITIAFVMINLAVFSRVIMPLLVPSLYTDWLSLSSSLWVIAFSIFTVYYMPILLRKRADSV